ncbi:hypothetical protein COCNU_scaffold000512G000010 [Cocos nucifera]|nr:hypothetical protein [Cocos nucifera]
MKFGRARDRPRVIKPNSPSSTPLQRIHGRCDEVRASKADPLPASKEVRTKKHEVLPRNEVRHKGGRTPQQITQMKFGRARDRPRVIKPNSPSSTPLQRIHGRCDEVRASKADPLPASKEVRTKKHEVLPRNEVRHKGGRTPQQITQMKFGRARDRPRVIKPNSPSSTPLQRIHGRCDEVRASKADPLPASKEVRTKKHEVLPRNEVRHKGGRTPQQITQMKFGRARDRPRVIKPNSPSSTPLQRIHGRCDEVRASKADPLPASKEVRTKKHEVLPRNEVRHKGGRTPQQITQMKFGRARDRPRVIKPNSPSSTPLQRIHGRCDEVRASKADPLPASKEVRTKKHEVLPRNEVRHKGGRTPQQITQMKFGRARDRPRVIKPNSPSSTPLQRIHGRCDEVRASKADPLPASKEVRTKKHEVLPRNEVRHKGGRTPQQITQMKFGRARDRPRVIKPNSPSSTPLQRIHGRCDEVRASKADPLPASKEVRTKKHEVLPRNEVRHKGGRTPQQITQMKFGRARDRPRVIKPNSPSSTPLQRIHGRCDEVRASKADPLPASKEVRTKKHEVLPRNEVRHKGGRTPQQITQMKFGRARDRPRVIKPNSPSSTPLQRIHGRCDEVRASKADPLPASKEVRTKKHEVLPRNEVRHKGGRTPQQITQMKFGRARDRPRVIKPNSPSSTPLQRIHGRCDEVRASKADPLPASKEVRTKKHEVLPRNEVRHKGGRTPQQITQMKFGRARDRPRVIKPNSPSSTPLQRIHGRCDEVRASKADPLPASKEVRTKKHEVLPRNEVRHKGGRTPQQITQMKFGRARDRPRVIKPNSPSSTPLQRIHGRCDEVRASKADPLPASKEVRTKKHEVLPRNEVRHKGGRTPQQITQMKFGRARDRPRVIKPNSPSSTPLQRIHGRCDEVRASKADPLPASKEVRTKKHEVLPRNEVRHKGGRTPQQITQMKFGRARDRPRVIKPNSPSSTPLQRIHGRCDEVRASKADPLPASKEVRTKKHEVLPRNEVRHKGGRTPQQITQMKFGRARDRPRVIKPNSPSSTPLQRIHGRCDEVRASKADPLPASKEVRTKKHEVLPRKVSWESAMKLYASEARSSPQTKPPVE